MARPKRAAVRSKRVAWPEPGIMNGGEFRLTWGRLAAIAAVLAAIPSIWAIGGHYMNKDEITQALDVNKKIIDENKKASDKALAAHADHDNGVQAWTNYNFAANRVEYLEDRAAECEAKKIGTPKLSAADVAICSRYDTKLKIKTEEAANLKAKAADAVKEKSQ